MILPHINHIIQKDILKQLSRHSGLSFTELKPRGLGHGLFAYHIKRLMMDGFLKKDAMQYILTTKVQQYVSMATRTNLDIILQPKLFSLLIIENDLHEFVMHKRAAQPFLGLYTFPGGSLFFDEPLEELNERQMLEKMGFGLLLQHRGIVSVRLQQGRDTLAHSYIHLHYGRVVGRPKMQAKDRRFTPSWINPLITSSDACMPDIVPILHSLAQHKTFFFEELII